PRGIASGGRSERGQTDWSCPSPETDGPSGMSPWDPFYARRAPKLRAVLAHLHDLHRVGPARLADRLADGEHDEVAILHHAVAHQDRLGLGEQLLAVVA